jgi:hypothetical protein
METITEIDLIFSDLKNEVITEKQAHQKVLDLFQSLTPMSEEEIREWYLHKSKLFPIYFDMPISPVFELLKEFQSHLLSQPPAGMRSMTGDEIKKWVWNGIPLPDSLDEVCVLLKEFQSHLLSRVEDKKGDRPKVICLCGSTKFKDAFIKSNFEFTMQGYIVLSVGWFSHSDGSIYTPTQKEKIELDELHKRKIDLADEVFIINKDGYIGESTNSELHYAMKKGKKITFMETVSGSFSKSIEDKGEKEDEQTNFERTNACYGNHTGD